MNYSGSNAEGGVALANEVISMRYYFNAELGPSSLKAALEKVKGVTKVEFDAATRTVRVNYGGPLKSVLLLEQAAATSGVPAALVSHARIILAVKVIAKGASLEKLQSELGGLSGVKKATVQGQTVELFADLDQLSFDGLKAACANANFEPKLNSHEWVTVKLKSGDATNMQKDLVGTKGVIVVKSASGEAAEMWTIKKVADDTFKKLAEKATAVFDSVVRQ